MLSRDVITTDAMLSILSNEKYLYSMSRFEAALAKASSIHGIIPADAANFIANQCENFHPNLDSLVTQARFSGPMAIPFVEMLRATISLKDTSAADWLHLGATSQDVLDTALCMQIKAASQTLAFDLDEMLNNLCALAQNNINTAIIGRTLLQHAQPTTLGLKFAQWAVLVRESAQELMRAANKACLLQLGGATGTFSALGTKGPDIARDMARELGLGWAGASWHNRRNRLVMFGSALGIMVGVLGKIARDIGLLMQTEIGEISEPTGDGKGGSSAMPHKHNPVAAVIAISAAIRAPGLVSGLIGSLPSNEHERGLGGWQSERPMLEDLLLICHGSVCAISDALKDIRIDKDKITMNLNETLDRSASDLVLRSISAKISHMRAKELVKSALEKSHNKNTFIDDLYGEKDINQNFDRKFFDEMIQIQNQIGLSKELSQILVKQARLRIATIQNQKSGFTDFRDMRIFWRTDGHFSKPALIFGNSLGTDTMLWDKITTELSKYYYIIRFDLPGHGLTQVPHNAMHINDIADGVISILDQLNIQKAVYCGVSVGGQIGLSLAIRHAERLNGAILCCTAAKIGDADSWNMRITRVKTTGMAKLAPEIIERWFGSRMRLETHSELEVWEQKLAQLNPDGYVKLCQSLADADFRQDAPKITIPILCVTGNEDKSITPSQVEELSRSITGSNIIHLDNVGHIPPVEAPDDTIIFIHEFMHSINQ